MFDTEILYITRDLSILSPILIQLIYIDFKSMLFDLLKESVSTSTKISFT